MEVGRMRMSLKGGILLLFLFSVYVAPGCTTEMIQTAETTVENVNEMSSQLDFTEMIEDAQGDGWMWEADTKTLRLDGLNLYWDGEDLSGGEVIIVPEDTTIVLEEGSVNVIQSTVAKKLPSRNMAAISCEGNITFEGTGSLEITGQSRCGIEASWGNVTINNGTYILSGIHEYSFDAGGDFVVNQGDVKIADGSIVFDRDFIINGGTVTINERMFLMDRIDGSFILNGGCLECVPTEPREEEQKRNFQIMMLDERNSWIINGGELYTTDFYTDGSLTINGGYVEIDGDGLSVGYLGQYVQSGGTVVIRSDYQGLGNRLSTSFDNRDKERFVITGGELQVTTRDQQYGAMEFIAESGIVLEDYIEIGEDMICEPAEWITIDEIDYPFVRQRNTEQYIEEEKEYQILTLKMERNLQEGQFPGAQTVTIRER